MKWAILWTNPANFAREWESYDTEAEARKMLVEYSAGYPWNDYHMVEVVETRAKTVAKQPMRDIITFTGGGGGARATITNVGSDYTGKPA